MSPAFSGLGPTVGTLAERLAITSPENGQLFYQTDTDEYVRYSSNYTTRWYKAEETPGRNLIINGDFSVAQRSTTSVAISTTPSYNAVDRWMTSQSGTANASVQQIVPVALTTISVASSGGSPASAVFTVSSTANLYVGMWVVITGIVPTLYRAVSIITALTPTTLTLNMNYCYE